ncbi:MAG: hypothetical protein QGH24_01815 [Candidatus Marinimicrobia bacterium]|jgi:hypothetical protein|nr:hypothetical protein [Candidatus Neomarinimicrobiota bacterium]
MLAISLINAQSITVRYIDVDTEAELFGQWELYDNEGNWLKPW